MDDLETLIVELLSTRSLQPVEIHAVLVAETEQHIDSAEVQLICNELLAADRVELTDAGLRVISERETQVRRMSRVLLRIYDGELELRIAPTDSPEERALVAADIIEIDRKIGLVWRDNVWQRMHELGARALAEIALGPVPVDETLAVRRWCKKHGVDYERAVAARDLPAGLPPRVTAVLRILPATKQQLRRALGDDTLDEDLGYLRAHSLAQIRPGTKAAGAVYEPVERRARDESRRIEEST